MEVKEIQIGDWIKRVAYLNGRDNPPYITNIQIKNIYGNEINCKTRDYTILSGTRLLECEPIPLTEEILINNGFEDLGKYFRLQDDILMIHRNCGKLWVIIGTWAIDIQYIHQLQHLLRLCGLNDLADNFKIK